MASTVTGMIKGAQHWRIGIFLAVWFGLMCGGRSQLFQDPGTFWHVVVGDRILKSGELIHTDPFSFTFGGRPWIAQWWLADCVLALVHRLAGLDSLLLATASVLAIFFGWLAHRLLRAGIHGLVCVLLVALGIAASAYHFHPRPHLATVVFLGLTFAGLCDFEAGRIGLGRLTLLIPLYVVWTNMHGGMVGGVLTMAACLGGWFCWWLIGRESPIHRPSQLGWLSLLVTAAALTALVNPYGVQLPRVWFELMGSPVLPRVMIEHGPLRVDEPVGWVVLGLGVVYVAALIGVLPGWPRVTWLIPLLWLGLTGMRIRHGPLFAVTATLALGEMFPHVRWVSFLARHGSELLQIQPLDERVRGGWPSLAAAVPMTGLILVSLICQWAGAAVPVLGRGWARPNPEYWPMELLPRLHEFEHASGNGTPIFNDMLYGGFLIYYTPGYRVFIDDRCELYGDKQLLAYAEALREPDRIERWVERYQFKLAVTARGSGFDRFLRGSGRWDVVEESKVATLFRRKDAPGDGAANE